MQHLFKFEEDRLMDEVALWERSEVDKGQIYTRPEVVEFMLTAIGLNSEESFENARILEPSCGEGEFVLAIVDRMINLPTKKPTINQLLNKLLAIDLMSSSIDITKLKVTTLLVDNSYTPEEISLLLDSWFLTTDFLLADIESNFTHVIGNPPYVRLENIPKKLLDEYRRRFFTMTDRADLYIPFYEKSLSLLRNNGKISFICTDRWTKNIYGRTLRKLIYDHYSLELFIDLYGIDAFEKNVMAYPAITQIVKKQKDSTILKRKMSFSKTEAQEILDAIEGKKTNIQFRKGIVNSDKPWLLGSSDQVGLIRKLENTFPLLEDVGCKVFIGTATGSNKVYIVKPDHLGFEIEESRLLPVVTASELKSGIIKWKGKYLVNTYNDSGVIDLADFPKLSSYLNNHKDILSERHVAKKDSEKWFKTIDRVYENRARMEKLLIPDISNAPVVLYDKGEYHPNNSIYYICSNGWDLHALRTVLLSNITKLFISTYSTKIAKGYLRFQAQHLRKLRIPNWDSIDNDLKQKMITAGKENDLNSYTKLTCEMYKLNRKEKLMMGL